MPKIERGRLSGLYGMQTHTCADLYASANYYETQVNDPLNTDDPRWLKRRADRLRRLADKKLKALVHKVRQ